MRIGAALAAMLFLCMPVAAQDIDALLAEPAPHETIDGMPSGRRDLVVAALGRRLEGQVSTVGQVLCAIRPWKTGSKAGDEELQRTAYRLMQAEPSAESTDFRWLDCVAGNREGYYRAAALDPMFDLRQAYCAGQSDKSGYAPDLAGTIDRLRAFDSRTAAGLAAAKGPDDIEKFSYYPLRNSLRLANLRAARAVSLWEESPGAARKQLREAADGLDDTLAALDVANTRNGWRLYNDVAFHAALYRWLTDGEDRSAIEAFLDPIPVVDDPALRDALTPEVMREMPEDFVDPIYIERLLPGAQVENGGAECAAWHRRSYHPRDLARAVLACDDSDLLAFDDCMAGFEASDWTVVISTLPRQVSRSEQDRLLGMCREFIEAARSRDRDGAAAGAFQRMGDVVVEPTMDVTPCRASGEVTTSDRAVLQPLFEATRLHGIEPLFRRPRTY
ncbi:MAG: hypothetical protein WBA25_06135 [Jannaschia sp.]